MAELLLRYLPVLFAADALLVVAHLALGESRFWNLDKEYNLPTWFSGVQLVLLALAALDCYERERSSHRRFFPRTGSWALLAVLFLYLSLDETTVIHEGVLRQEFRDLLPPDSLWISLLPWQILFGPLLALVALLLLALFLTRFSRTPALLRPALAGIGCWFAAILAEGLAKPLFMARGWYRYEVAVEEGFELLGATLLLVGVCRYAAALGRGPVPAIELREQYRRFAAAAAAILAVIAIGASVVVAASLRNSAWLYRHNASQLAKQKKCSEAIVAYQKALERNPRDAATWSGLALCHYRLGDYEAGLAAYDRALELKADDARLWSYRGAILHRLGRFAEAEAAYRKAIERNPRYSRAIAQLGLVLEKQGRVPEAITAYREALRLDPRERLASRGLERLGTGPPSRSE